MTQSRSEASFRDRLVELFGLRDSRCTSIIGALQAGFDSMNNGLQRLMIDVHLESQTKALNQAVSEGRLRT